MGGDESFGIVVGVAVVVHDGADDAAEVDRHVEGAVVFQAVVKELVVPAHGDDDVVPEGLFGHGPFVGDEPEAPRIFKRQDLTGDLPAGRHVQQKFAALVVLQEESKEALADAKHGVELVFLVHVSFSDGFLDDFQ